MKFLISSKYFHAKIAEAIGKESYTLSINHRLIFFSGNGGTTEMTIEPIDKYETSFDFSIAYWRDVVMYLKQLPEQPIKVDLDYDRVEIYGVAVFKILSE